MATIGRLTRQSVENLKVADRAGIWPMEVGGVAVWVEKNGNRVVLCNSGGAMVYNDRAAARRAVARINRKLSDLSDI